MKVEEKLRQLTPRKRLGPCFASASLHQWIYPVLQK